jgi:hypothetical protein
MAALAQTPSTTLERGPNCWRCRFFGVSHLPATPYACRAMGFQSKTLPCLEVLRADGHFCRAFEAKVSVNQPNSK